MNFTNHFHSSLVQAGIRTFLDDKEIPKGETISSKLLNAIQRSKISIVVFSKRYASFSWCLDELAKIIECRQTIGHTLIPIFYYMDPSDVRQQTWTFAEAFSKHKKWFQTNLKRVQRWRDALTTAANCSGFHLESTENGYMLHTHVLFHSFYFLFVFSTRIDKIKVEILKIKNKKPMYCIILYSLHPLNSSISFCSVG
jgi:hypothetical protein